MKKLKIILLVPISLCGGSLGVQNERLKETALLNGGDSHEVIPANTLLEVVEKAREEDG